MTTNISNQISIIFVLFNKRMFYNKKSEFKTTFERSQRSFTDDWKQFRGVYLLLIDKVNELALGLHLPDSQKDIFIPKINRGF